MYKEGHFGLGLLTTSVFALITAELGYLNWIPLIALAGIAGGLLPDIDNKPVVPFKHHGYTHTVLFGLISSVVVAIPLLSVIYGLHGLLNGTSIALPTPSVLEYIFLFFILYISSLTATLSHLFGDALSTAGGTLLIKPWRPLSDNYVRFGVTTAGNKYYNHGFFISGAISHGVIYYIYLP